MLKKSPASQFHIFRIPEITVIGVLASLFMALEFWWLWNDEVAAGHNPVAIGRIAYVYPLGLLLHIITSYYRRLQGLRIERIFEEIPIE
jgi:hypothetical protein